MRPLYTRFEGYGDLGPLLDASDEEVLLRLGGRPALVRIAGTAGDRARVVACLLHGNEDSGYRAVLGLLREGPTFPYDLWVLIGNVRAASQDGWFAHRYLDDQEDFNRVWGLEPPTTRMRRCASAILEVLLAQPLEAAIDIHNNTGDNPFYAILPQVTPEAMAIAATCADLGLVWRQTANTLMERLLPRCAAIALECGLPGIPAHATYAREALDRFLAQPRFEDVDARPAAMYEIRHRVTVRPEVPFAFGGVLTEELDLVLVPGLDGHNFGMLLAGEVLGHVHPGAAMPLSAVDAFGVDETARYFEVKADGRLVTREDLTPVMMTTNVVQTRRDCLFYVARRRA